MKLRIIAVIAIMSVVWIAQSAFATDASTEDIGPGAYVASEPKSDVYYHIGPLNLVLPWETVNVVYLYDFNAEKSMVGGEAVIATLWKFQGTVGGVTDIDGRGSPFVGGNLWFPNPIPSIAILNEIKPGIFGGYDWDRGASMFGVKAAVEIF